MGHWVISVEMSSAPLTWEYSSIRPMMASSTTLDILHHASFTCNSLGWLGEGAEGGRRGNNVDFSVDTGSYDFRVVHRYDTYAGLLYARLIRARDPDFRGVDGEVAGQPEKRRLRCRRG